MKYRFFIYGLLGITMEIFWTGLGSLIKGDPTLQGFSYLWMFPIYGSAVFLEPVHHRIRNLTWVFRGLFWMTVIFSMEFLTGFLLKTTVGVIPWDYSRDSVLSVGGFIRLDYAPVWFFVGLMFEQAHDFIRRKVRL